MKRMAMGLSAQDARLALARLDKLEAAKPRRLPRQEVVLPENYLEVGLTPDGRQVLVNHPQIMVDSKGCGHIVFSPDQARNLARTLLRKAAECKA